jgi:nucleoside-diphosphate-sugar epimerase
MILVTGCAGFVGSHLTERLLADGFKVRGIDRFSDYYGRDVKKENMAAFAKDKGFSFVEGDLAEMDLSGVLKGVDVVFHQAAQAGVRQSWGSHFQVYLRDNVLATQRLLDACSKEKIKKFIFASSSSVYGDAEAMPTKETAVPRPLSPYGVTKLSGEHLCYLYQKNYGVPFTSLRYFSVYGPRQRPDMAFHRFISAMLAGRKIEVYGSGEQTRDFTYVSDIVEANMLAMKAKAEGETFNIGGGGSISVNKTISILEKYIGKKAVISKAGEQRGDARHTSADIGKARKMLGYAPKVRIEEGLKKQLEWMQGS